VGIAAAIAQSFLLPGLPEWQQFVLVSMVSLTATILGTHLTEPTDEKVLRHFYETTRPFGMWKPCREKLDPAAREAMLREHRNDLLAIPFAIVWQVTLFLLPMQLMIRSFSVFQSTLLVFVVCLLGLYWFWYRRLPSSNPGEQMNAPEQVKDKKEN
jgi:membrane protein implicated in regulation of membrane protease activity